VEPAGGAITYRARSLLKLRSPAQIQTDASSAPTPALRTRLISIHLYGVMRIRLTKRFAKFIDGIDLSAAAAGDVLDLSPREAALLIREGWAASIEDVDGRGGSVPPAPHEAKKTPRRSRKSTANLEPERYREDVS
jgi:hypothetical protein